MRLYEDISWLDNDRLIARGYAVDAMGRLQRSKLFILSPTLIPQQQRLTNLPDTQLEIAYAVLKRTVAFQVYDTTKDEFILALTHVGDPLKKIERLDLPASESGKPQRHARVQEMVWSPNGQYLAVREGHLVRVWDAKNKDWLLGRTRGYAAISTSAVPIVWVTENQIANMAISGNFDTDSPIGGLLNIFTLMGGGIDLGELRGLTLLKMFAANQR